jgi:hypothetical protein
LEDVNMRTIIRLVGGFVVSALARSQADTACGKASRRRGVLTGEPHPDGQEGGRVLRTVRTAARTAVALVTMAALGGSVQLASAPPAAAFLELERAESKPVLRSMDSPQGAQAFCPSGKVVVGGGAEIEGGGDDPATQPRLTRLQPLGFNFDVTAEAPNHASEAPWLVRAYAICADADALDMDHYRIVPGASAKDSQSFKDAVARCPDGTVAFGAGGMILYRDFSGYPPPARVGLQLVRPSGPLDIARATGREYGDGIEDGYFGNWEVIAWAICAPPVGGIHAEGTGGLVDGEKATHVCSDSPFVAGAGGGGGPFINGGDAYLQYIIPSEELTHVFVRLTQPLDPSVGGMVASATCAE